MESYFGPSIIFISYLSLFLITHHLDLIIIFIFLIFLNWFLIVLIVMLLDKLT